MLRQRYEQPESKSTLRILSLQLQAGLFLNLASHASFIKSCLQQEKDAKTVLAFIQTLQAIGCPNELIIDYVIPNDFKSFQNTRIKEDLYDIISKIKNPYVASHLCNQALDPSTPIGYIIKLTRRPFEWGASQDMPDLFRRLRRTCRTRLPAANNHPANHAAIEVNTQTEPQLPPQLQYDSEVADYDVTKKILSLIGETLDSYRNYNKLVKKKLDTENSVHLRNETRETLIQLFEIYPSLINVRFNTSLDAMTPLLFAVLTGTTDLVVHLINRGADIHIYDAKFGYAYEAAAAYGKPEMIEAFLLAAPHHVEMRQTIITHLCARLYELT